MLSHKSLIVSVVLVIAYLVMELVEENISREHMDISMIINYIDEGLMNELVGLESNFEHSCMKRKSYKKYNDSYDNEKEFLSLISSSNNLAKTTKGQKILNMYGLSIEDINKQKTIKNLIVHREEINRISDYISKIEKQETKRPEFINSLIRLENQNSEYTSGEIYDLNFQVLSQMRQVPKAILYDVGNGLDTVRSIPMVFKLKPENLRIEYLLYNDVTGESKTYKQKVLP